MCPDRLIYTPEDLVNYHIQIMCILVYSKIVVKIKTMECIWVVCIIGNLIRVFIRNLKLVKTFLGSCDKQKGMVSSIFRHVKTFRYGQNVKGNVF